MPAPRPPLPAHCRPRCEKNIGFWSPIPDFQGSFAIGPTWAGWVIGASPPPSRELLGRGGTARGHYAAKEKALSGTATTTPGASRLRQYLTAERWNHCAWKTLQGEALTGCPWDETSKLHLWSARRRHHYPAEQLGCAGSSTCNSPAGDPRRPMHARAHSRVCFLARGSRSQRGREQGLTSTHQMSGHVARDGVDEVEAAPRLHLHTGTRSRDKTTRASAPPPPRFDRAVQAGHFTAQCQHRRRRFEICGGRVPPGCGRSGHSTTIPARPCFL